MQCHCPATGGKTFGDRKSQETCQIDRKPSRFIQKPTDIPGHDPGRPSREGAHIGDLILL